MTDVDEQVRAYAEWVNHHFNTQRLDALEVTTRSPRSRRGLWAAAVAATAVATGGLALQLTAEDPDRDRAAVEAAADPEASTSAPATTITECLANPVGSDPDSVLNPWATAEPPAVEPRIPAEVPSDLRPANASRTISGDLGDDRTTDIYQGQTAGDAPRRLVIELIKNPAEPVPPRYQPTSPGATEETVDLAGTSAKLVSSPQSIPSGEPQLLVVWEPAPGATIVVQGLNLQRNELLAIAESVDITGLIGPECESA
jgi:hypothetical protein